MTDAAPPRTIRQRLAWGLATLGVLVLGAVLVMVCVVVGGETSAPNAMSNGGETLALFVVVPATVFVSGACFARAIVPQRILAAGREAPFLFGVAAVGLAIPMLLPSPLMIFSVPLGILLLAVGVRALSVARAGSRAR